MNTVDPNRPTNWSSLVRAGGVATLGGLLFGSDTAVISGAIEPLRVFFNLDRGMKGWAAACALVGCVAGVLLAGPMNDRMGRRATLLVAAVLFLVSALGSALPRTFTEFVIFRIIGGFGVGIASMTSPMYIAEISPARLRGRMVSLNQLAIVSGMLVVYFVNYFISGQGDDAWSATTGWRWMFGSEALPAVVLLGALFMVPESPRFLCRKERRTRPAPSSSGSTVRSMPRRKLPRSRRPCSRRAASSVNCAIVVLVAAMIGCACPRSPAVGGGKPHQETVVLLHGLGRTSRSMNCMEKSLSEAGDTVSSLRYPSTTMTDFAAVDTAHPFITRNKKVIELTISFLKHGSFGAAATQVKAVHHHIHHHRPMIAARVASGGNAERLDLQIPGGRMVEVSVGITSINPLFRDQRSGPGAFPGKQSPDNTSAPRTLTSRPHPATAA